jgi:hydroxymethylglutaryl-CoA synthase
MSNNGTNPGVSGMSVYLPAPRVNLEQWCGWTGNAWDKIRAVVGGAFASAIATRTPTRWRRTPS